MTDETRRSRSNRDAKGVDPAGLSPRDESLLRSVLEARASLADDTSVPDLIEQQRIQAQRPNRPLARIMVAAAGCAVLVAGVTVAVRRGAPVEVSAASPTALLERLRQSSDTARAWKSFAFALDASVSQDSSTRHGCANTTNRTGRIDPRSGLTQLDVQGGVLVLDASSNGYLSAAAAPSGWAVRTPFLHFSLTHAARASFAVGKTSPLSITSGSDLTVSMLAGKFDELQASASSVEIQGREQVRGIDTTHATVVLDQQAFASWKARTTPNSLDVLVKAGLLSPGEARGLTPAGSTAGTTLPPFPDELRADAWIDDQGLIRRLVTSQHPEPSTSPNVFTSTYTATIEYFDFNDTSIKPPAPESTTDLGLLPATVLQPANDRQTQCGQSPTETLRSCAAEAFKNESAGKTVDEFIATIPKTAQSLITPNGWFPQCGPGGSPSTPAPTMADAERARTLAGIDVAHEQRFIAATDTNSSLHTVAPEMRLYLAALACLTLSRAPNPAAAKVDLLVQAYVPNLVTGGPPKDQYRLLLTAATDPSTGLCPS